MEYDTITAAHYAAWRPPLHARILELGLREDERFARGLDVGCGTGHSTRALKKYCGEVVGIDPSASMIAAAPQLDGVHFVAQSGLHNAVDKGSAGGKFDLFSFAGTLHYQDPQQTLKDISGLAADGAAVLVYDFDVQLGPVVKRTGWRLPTSDYDHRKTFSSNDGLQFSFVAELEESISFRCTPTELTHLLFSVKSWRESAFNDLSYEEVVAGVTGEFGPQLALTARVYLTRFSF